MSPIDQRLYLSENQARHNGNPPVGFHALAFQNLSELLWWKPELPLDHPPRIRHGLRPRYNLPVLRKWNQFHTSHKSIPGGTGKAAERRGTIHGTQTGPEGDSVPFSSVFRPFLSSPSGTVQRRDFLPPLSFDSTIILFLSGNARRARACGGQKTGLPQKENSAAGALFIRYSYPQAWKCR